MKQFILILILVLCGCTTSYNQYNPIIAEQDAKFVETPHRTLVYYYIFKEDFIK